MIKIDIISGFLGAGKTTFIKKLLREYRGENIVIIENEFGDIGIDGEILEREGYKMYEISTGCICCLMRNDFFDTLKSIINDIAPRRVIIEPTGISILSDILTALRQEPFLQTCKINSLITIVDCESYLEQSEIFGEFFEDQIANATHLLLSKISGASEETIQEIYTSLRLHNPTAPVVAKEWNEMDAQELYGYLNGDLIWDYARELVPPNRRPCREGKFITFAKEIKHEISLQKLREKLAQLNGGEYGKVLRGKGLIKCSEHSFEFSCVNGSYEIRPLDYEARGKICFIGTDLNKNNLNLLWSE